MTDNLEYIDNYFKKELTPEESGQFEQRITDDPAFAEEVAFYLNTLNTAKTEIAAQKKEMFREIYKKPRPVPRPNLVRKLWPYVAAAAAIVIVVLGIYLFGSSESTQELADTYIIEKFQKLRVTMDAGIDSVKIGVQFFNDGKLDSAQIYFQTILQRDTTSTRDSSLFEIMEFAGITSLKLKQYDKAIDYFSRMERVPGLYANNGMFYHALALIQRKRPGDMEEAWGLLKMVVENNQDEKETAEKWLEKWSANTDNNPVN